MGPEAGYLMSQNHRGKTGFMAQMDPSSVVIKEM